MPRSYKILLYSFLGLLFVIVSVVGISIRLLYKYQDKITQQAIANVNERFTGVLIVGDSYVSPFKNFPYISVDLHHVQFFIDKEMKEQPLYELEDVYLGFDILQIITGNFEIKSILIDGGHLDVIQFEDGQYNLLMAKNVSDEEDDDLSDEEEFLLNINKIQIKNFDASLYKIENKQLIAFRIDDLVTSFKLAKDHIYCFLDTELVLDISADNKPSFFYNKDIELHTTIDLDKIEESLLLTDTQVTMEKGVFGLSGTIDYKNDLRLDLVINGDKPDFNLFIAFAPDEIAEVLRMYESGGKVFFNGVVQGKFIDGKTPFFHVDFGCENAFFKNQQNNKTVEDVSFKGYITNGKERDIHTMELALTDFSAKPDKGVFKADIIVRNFIDPYIATNIYSDLDLEFIGDFLGVEGLQRLSGHVILNMKFNELVDVTLPENSLLKLKEGVQSELIVENLSFLIPGYDVPVRNTNIHAQMESGELKLDSLSFKIGDSDVYIDGFIDNLPAIFHHQSSLVNVLLNAKSKQLLLSDFLPFDTSMVGKGVRDFKINLAFETSVAAIDNADPLPIGEFFIKDLYARPINYPHVLHDIHADVFIKENQFKLVDFSGEIDESDFHFSGELNNYKLWFEEELKGKSDFVFKLNSDLLKLNDLLTVNGVSYLPEDYRDEELRKFNLDGRVAIDFDKGLKSADLFIYHVEALLNLHPLRLEEFKGQFHFEDEHLIANNFMGKMGRSDFVFDLNLYTGDVPELKKRDNKFSFRSKTLDLDQLTNYNPKDTTSHEDAFNVFEIPFTDIAVDVQVQKLNYHKIILENFDTKIRMQEDHYVYIDTLSMLAAGGEIGMKGYFNGNDPKNIYLHNTLVMNNIDLDKMLFKFDNFGNDYVLNENLNGTLSGFATTNIKLHPDLTPILDKGDGHIEVMILKGELKKFAPMVALSSFFKDKNLNLIRFDTLQNIFDLKDGVLHIPAMTINSSIGYLEISGKQSLTTEMDYFVRVPMKLVTQVGVSKLFGKKKEIDEDQVDDIQYRDNDKRTRFLNLRITGNSEDFDISLGKDKT